MSSAHVGFIGLGLMGKPMARNLLKKGFRRRRPQPQPRPGRRTGRGRRHDGGLTRPKSRGRTRIITMLPDGPDVEKVLEGGERRASARCRKARSSSTRARSAPAIARRLAGARRSELGATMLDAPVSGGEIGAIDGTLTFMVGGDAAALEIRARPILARWANPIASSTSANPARARSARPATRSCWAARWRSSPKRFALSRKAGVDPAKVRAALMGGFAQSRVLEVHGERMITGNWKPGFKAKLFKKDLGIAMNTLAENGVPARDERGRASSSSTRRSRPAKAKRITRASPKRSSSLADL